MQNVKMDDSMVHSFYTLTLEERKRKRWHDLKISPVAAAIFMIGIYFTWISKGFNFENKPWTFIHAQGTPLLGSMIPLGAVLGTLPIGILADKYGRKSMTCFSIVPMVISPFVIDWPEIKAWHYLIRLFAGIGCGASSVVIPMYLYEIADKSYKENITRYIHMYINIGLYFACLVDFMGSFGTVRSVICLVMAGCYSILILTLPESPTWLLARGREEEAKSGIKKLMGKEAKLETIEHVKYIANAGFRLDTFKLMSNKKKDVALILGLIVFQQLSGIGALTFYSQKLFYFISDTTYLFQAMILIPLGSIAVAYFNITLVNRFGEKRLLKTSTSWMTATSIFLAWYSHFPVSADSGEKCRWLAIILLLIYLFAFHIGWGPVPWIMIGKMFPNSTRKLMYNLALTCAWVTLFITTFQELLDLMETIIIFLIYGFINLISAIFVSFAVPKTINAVDEEISDDLEMTNMNLTSTLDNV